jgi:hypothetical protein
MELNGIKMVKKYKQNCGVCMLCQGLAQQPKCPICGSTKAKRMPYGEYGTIYVECENGHKYDMAKQIDYDDIHLHQHIIDNREVKTKMPKQKLKIELDFDSKAQMVSFKKDFEKKFDIKKEEVKYVIN